MYGACAPGAGATQDEFYLRLPGVPGKHGACDRRSAHLCVASLA